MKKGYCLLLLLFFAKIGFAQVLTQSFDGAVFPPTGWLNTLVSTGTPNTGDIDGDVWTRVTSGNNEAATVAPHSGAAMAKYASYDYNRNSSASLTTPQLNFSSGGPFRVRFWMYRSATYPNRDSIDVFVNTSTDLNSATKLGSAKRLISEAPVLSAPAWDEYIFNIPASFNTTSNYIIFQAIGMYGLNMFIDDIVVEAVPSCLPPTALTANPAATTAAISWTAPTGSPASYQWEVRSSGAGGSGASGLVSSGSTTAPTVTANATGLTANTAYTLYVRTNCGGSDFSAWASKTFTTLCSGVNLPYSLDFNTVIVPALPSCVSKQDINGDNFSWATFTPSTPTATLPSTLVRYSYNTDGSTPADDWMFTQGLNLVTGTTYQLKFKYKASNGPTYVEKLEVKYGTSAVASAMTSSAIFTNTNIASALADPYADANVTFTVPANGVYYLGFHAFSIPDQAYLYIDDILVQVLPTCDQPTAITPSAITSSTATVSWTAPAVGTVTNYSWELRTSGAAGSGPTGLVNSGSTATTSVGLTGMSQVTTYTFYVRTNCTSPDVSSYNSATFATVLVNDEPCPGPALTINASGCTSSLSGTTNGATTSTGLGYTNAVGCAVAASPKDVWYKVTTNASGGGSTSVMFTLTPTAGSTLVSGTLILFSATGTCPTLTLAPVTGACAAVASISNTNPMIMTATGLTPSTTYYLRINPYFSADATGDFTICATVPPSPPASCATGQVPANNATGVSYPSTSLSWNAVTGATSYDVYFGTANPPTTSNNTTATSVSPTGLAASTTYYWYVVPKNLGGPATGCNTPVYSFTTAAVPPPAPANDDCSAAVTLTGWANNVAGTTVSATQSMAPATCNTFTSAGAGDVWFKFTTQNAGAATVITNGMDAIIEAFSGTCGSLTSMGCVDVSGNVETMNLTGLTANTTYYLRVYGWGAVSAAQANFTISMSGAALPVSIADFKGVRQANNNLLSWITATEINNAGFELQRSVDGINFSSLTFVASKANNGSSNAAINYSFSDKVVLSGSYYYRLKQIDRDGKSTMSNVVFIKGTKATKLELVSIYPNPAIEKLNVSVSSPKTDLVTFIVSDLAGKVVTRQSANVVNGDNNIQLNVSSLAKGTYTIKVVCADGCETAINKFIKQ